MSCWSSSSSSSESEDEGRDAYRKGGYHAVRPGDRFGAGRYVAQRKLGWGHFSTVWLAYDLRVNKYVALKIQKSAAEFAESARHEINVLSAIAESDPTSSSSIVRLLDTFVHSGPNGRHLCLVVEHLGDSLLKLIKFNRYAGLQLTALKHICRSILSGLDHLHRRTGIIHADLKPENVLLVAPIDPAKDPARSGAPPLLERPQGGATVSSAVQRRLRQKAKRAVAKIAMRRASVILPPAERERSLKNVDLDCKIVDFGNACWAGRPLADTIQTRQYRAPEVIIGSGYSFPADIWSFGCMAFELATGEMLFSPKDGQGFNEDEDHLAQMMELLGKMPKKVALGGSRSKDYFDRHGDLKRIRRLKSWSVEEMLVQKYNFREPDAREFADFLRPVLEYEPEERPSAERCLHHPWLSGDPIAETNQLGEDLERLDTVTAGLRI